MRKSIPLFYATAPKWVDEVCPDTCEVAKPSDRMKVDNASVIRVNPAHYRYSKFSGVFLLATREIRVKSSGEPTIRVYCRWFGHKLKGGGPISLTLTPGHFEIIESWSGEIVTNLST